MNVFGPIARSAHDLEILLDVMAGPQPADERAWRIDLPAPRRTRIDEYRIATWFDEPDCPITTEYRIALERAAETMRAAGARVEASHPSVGFQKHAKLWMALAGSATAPSLPTEIAETAAGSHLRWLRNEERRQDLRRVWHTWFDDYDALLCPVTLSAAPVHNLEGDPMDRTIDIDGVPRSSVIEVPKWCGVFNLLGLPSCVVPIGRTDQGLPMGLQIVTAYLRDRESIELARRMEAIVAAYEPPPMGV
jgi:amidase